MELYGRHYVFIYLCLLLICSCHRSWCRYDRTNVAAGIKLAANDDILVSASNAFSNFAVVIHPFRNQSSGGSKRCSVRFNTSDRFVHSVAVVGAVKDGSKLDTFKFVFAAEKMSTMTPYICVASVAKSTCTGALQCTDVGDAESHQEYFLIAVDTHGTFAYGFTSSFVFKLEITTNRIVLNRTTSEMWPSLDFIPRALDISDSWAVIAGYGYSNIINKDYSALGCLIDLIALTSSSCVAISANTIYIAPEDVTSYYDRYEMSVAIRDERILIGTHRLESVVVLEKTGVKLHVAKTHTVLFADSFSFGRGVAWVDNTTFAVLAYNNLQTSGSKSIVFIYDKNSVNSTSSLYIFPNNQQILGSRLKNPFFARLIFTARGDIAVLTEYGDILIIPVAPIGYASAWIDTLNLTFVFRYRPMPCIGGTFKNISSAGHCQICPPRTRNAGMLSGGANVCIPCSNDLLTSFCPHASLADIDSNIVPSYSQAMNYPETGDTTDIEDILLQNVFQIGSEVRCKIISPLFWTLIVGALCLIIGFVMILLKRCGCHSCMPYRNKAKMIFKHTDIIGEGERWIGGLATFDVIVLVAFSYWFSASFIQRYPIEHASKPAAFVCNPTLINAKFSTGLQLLSLPKSADLQPIFTLLDKQTFKLTIELINTGFMCNHTTAQENFIDLDQVGLSVECTRSVSNAITSVTVALPSHQSTVQFNMTGPHWIGGIRLCIRGDGLTDNSTVLHQLDVCELYFTPNDTIGRKTIIPIIFVKNINMTQGLNTADKSLYSGVWIPSFSTVKLSDEAHYANSGNYLRYTSSLTVIQVTLDERPFFVKNIQEPIVRKAELIFHSLLFTSLCIELFAFLFLFMKLVLVPLVRWMENAWRKYRSHNTNTNNLDAIVFPSSQKIDITKENGDYSSTNTESNLLREITVM